MSVLHRTCSPLRVCHRCSTGTFLRTITTTVNVPEPALTRISPSQHYTRGSRSIHTSRSPLLQQQEQQVSRKKIDVFRNVPPSSPPYPVVSSCPDPQCACAATPAMPEGLPIDMTSPMTVPFYHRHVLTTMRHDSPTANDTSLDEQTTAALSWPSKIESDAQHLVTRLKAALKPSGAAYRPDFSVSVTASTLAARSAAEAGKPEEQGTPTDEVWVFPEFVRMAVPRTDDAGVALGHLVGTDAPIGDVVGRITRPVVLVCGHGKRDERCGILGPLLLREFGKHLVEGRDAHLGLVSHIGGHKFAGNVIVYMPPTATSEAGEEGGRREGLAIDGQGVWYGRVEPRHVEGIVNETIRGGRVIGELLRGVHDFGRSK